MYEQQKQVEKTELAAPVDYLLNLLSNSKPYFPDYLSRKLCEEVGVDCSDDMFYKLISVGVDHELKRLLQDINSTKIKRKKDDEQRTLKTSDVHKLFEGMDLPLQKPHYYPSLGITEDKTDNPLP